MGRSNKNTAVAEKQVRGWEGVQQAILEDERIVKEKNKVNEVQLKQATQNFTNTPSFQPESFQLKNMLITDKIYQNYYNQIRHNMYVGIKAIYLVCRDFYDAKLALTEGSYYELAKQLNVSRSTLIKYESIGKHPFLYSLYASNKLPESWTTQYYLTTFSEEELKDAKDKIGLKTTKGEVDKLLKVSNKNETPPATHYKFATILVPKDFVTNASFQHEKDIEKLKKHINTFSDDFYSVEFNEKTIESMLSKAESAFKARMKKKSKPLKGDPKDATDLTKLTDLEVSDPAALTDEEKEKQKANKLTKKIVKATKPKRKKKQ